MSFSVGLGFFLAKNVQVYFYILALKSASPAKNSGSF